MNRRRVVCVVALLLVGAVIFAKLLLCPAHTWGDFFTVIWDNIIAHDAPESLQPWKYR